MTDFDWHDEFTEAVAGAQASDIELLIWIMTDESREEYRQWLVRNGFKPEVDEVFGIEVQRGVPAGGKPFQLRLRRPH